jgi:hypothetical protein
MTNNLQHRDPEAITQHSLGSAAHAAQPQERLRRRRHPHREVRPQRVDLQHSPKISQPPSSPSCARGWTSRQSLPSLLRAGAVAPACRELRAPSRSTTNYFPRDIGPVLEPVFSAEGMRQRSADDLARGKRAAVNSWSSCVVFAGSRRGRTARCRIPSGCLHSKLTQGRAAIAAYPGLWWVIPSGSFPRPLCFRTARLPHLNRCH